MRAMAGASPARAGRAVRLTGSHHTANVDPRTLALLVIDEEVDLDRVLERILRAARTAAGARYAALGVPDGAGGFARFLTAGLSEARAARIGELPRVHGVLG